LKPDETDYQAFRIFSNPTYPPSIPPKLNQVGAFRNRVVFKTKAPFRSVVVISYLFFAAVKNVDPTLKEVLSNT